MIFSCPTPAIELLLERKQKFEHPIFPFQVGKKKKRQSGGSADLWPPCWGICCFCTAAGQRTVRCEWKHWPHQPEPVSAGPLTSSSPISPTFIWNRQSVSAHKWQRAHVWWLRVCAGEENTLIHSTQTFAYHFPSSKTEISLCFLSFVFLISTVGDLARCGRGNWNVRLWMW